MNCASLDSTALAVWTRQLAGLVGSGLPLERALTALTAEAETEPVRNLVASLRAEVNAGSSFAKALAQHPREFSDIYIAVIGAGFLAVRWWRGRSGEGNSRVCAA